MKPTIDQLTTALQKYRSGKKALESKIVENDRWFRSLHWDIIKGNKNPNEPEPVMAYLTNTIMNKHADAMDYFPEPIVLGRESNDVENAENLTKILPVVLEQNKFKKSFSDVQWYKIKQGTGVYGIFWDPEASNGLGDIDIVKLDLLNLYWEPGITDIQKSRYFFIVAIVDEEILTKMYPDKLDGRPRTTTLDIKQYVTDDTIDTTGKALVVDAYYKDITEDGKQILHMVKFVDDIELASSADEPAYENGLYDHGEYPIEFEVMFPEESTPVGFGYIDIIKNPQMFIDKLDQIISRNALIAGKQRYVVGASSGINEEELADMSKDVIHSDGRFTEGEDFSILQGKPLPAFIMQHRANKITELKEISGANDFSRGDTGGGITAASAIAMLQEAGNKLSRDMVSTTYDTYSRIMYKCISLISQFYDEERQFRITDDQGETTYVPFSNANLKPQPLPAAYEGEAEKYRSPLFDIKVKPEKASPFSRIAQNEMAKELYSLGFFNPEMAPQSKIALEMMSFEGKDRIVKLIAQNGDLYQQMQMMAQQLAESQAALQDAGAVIKASTGQDIFGGGGVM